MVVLRPRKGAILGFDGTTPIDFYPFAEKDYFIILAVADVAMTPIVVIPNVLPALVGCSTYLYAFIGKNDEAAPISYGYGSAETCGGATLMMVFSLLWLVTLGRLVVFLMAYFGEIGFAGAFASWADIFLDVLLSRILLRIEVNPSIMLEI